MGKADSRGWVLGICVALPPNKGLAWLTGFQAMKMMWTKHRFFNTEAGDDPMVDDPVFDYTLGLAAL
jgi:hypothetical protein